MKRSFTVLFIVFSLFLIQSCATFYELNYEFNQNFESGRLEEAEKSLAKSKKKMSRKARFLYLANRGVVSFMLGQHEESNKWLEEAYLYTEDYQTNYANVAASFLTNPNMVDYRGEDHEQLYVLYYKALNFCYLGDYEAALVECRRLNNRLYELSDKYKNENKFQEDAFIHNLMGIIYEASGDFNNAFIAYKNAINIYESTYQDMFGLSAPEQLKNDLIRSAYLTGFMDEVRFYEEKFDVRYNHEAMAEGGELVFFWHNGLIPVKDEWSINFTITGREDFVTFANDEYGLNFTFPYNFDNDEEGGQDIRDLQFIRVTFPKYIEREPFFEHGEVMINDQTISLEVAEDLNAIAFKSLKQRMVAEMSKSLLRAAIKKLAENELRKENESLGFVVGVMNAVSEKADTRNWQTLPHSIYYTRVPLDKGVNTVKLRMMRGNDGKAKIETFEFDGSPGKTRFHAYQTLQ